VGETAAEFIDWNLNVGLTNTTIIMGILLELSLFIQFRGKKYVPSIYWISVVLLSIFGTLITDNLTDIFEVPLETTTIVFSIALAVIFAAWYKTEKTLSIHSIYTTRREAFYWLAIFFTFALGTAVGDLVAETFDFGYLVTAAIFGAALAVISIAYFKLSLNSVLAFWLAYILTRPLGASIGDYLAQSPDSGGLGLGTLVTSAIFLIAILAAVIYLTFTKKDTPRMENAMVARENKEKKKVRKGEEEEENWRREGR
jgi:uncharacterized membrane-anchored protein